MDQNQQNQQPPQKPKWRSWVASSFGEAFGVGAAISVVFDLAYAVFGRNRPTIGSLARGAASGGIALSVLHLITRKQVPAEPVATLPPAPPSLPERPQGLELAKVPQILDMLVAKQAITAEQKAVVLESIKTGRSGFAGDIAVADGFVNKAQVDAALMEQAALKAGAAAIDIQNIKDHGALPHPAWLKSNWGNNGVTPAATHPTRTDGIAAAANAAQNLVMIANANPALAPQIFNGVIAGASLANGIASGDSPVTPIAKMGDVWRKTMNDALTAAAATNPAAMVDANGKPIDIHQYIAARDAEITAAIAQTLQQPPRQAGLAR